MRSEDKIILNVKEIADIKSFVRKNNEQNCSLKFSLRFEEGLLFSIGVRFLVPKQVFVGEKLRNEICDAITKISHNLLLPEKDNQIWAGIMEINVCSIHRGCRARYIISALSFIAEDMVDIIAGKKTLS